MVTGLGRCAVSSSHVPDPCAVVAGAFCKLQMVISWDMCQDCGLGGKCLVPTRVAGVGVLRAPGCLSLGGLPWAQLCSAFYPSCRCSWSLNQAPWVEGGTLWVRKDRTVSTSHISSPAAAGTASTWPGRAVPSPTASLGTGQGREWHWDSDKEGRAGQCCGGSEPLVETEQAVPCGSVLSGTERAVPWRGQRWEVPWGQCHGDGAGQCHGDKARRCHGVRTRQYHQGQCHGDRARQCREGQCYRDRTRQCHESQCHGHKAGSAVGTQQGQRHQGQCHGDRAGSAMGTE